MKFWVGQIIWGLMSLVCHCLSHFPGIFCHYGPSFVKVSHFFFTISTNNLACARSKFFWGVSGSEDRGGGDNSIQFINYGRMGDKSF